MKVGLLDTLLVDIDVSVLVDVDPFAAVGDHALDQYVVVVVKSDDLSRAHRAVLEGEDDVPVVQGSVHGLPVDMQDGQEQNRHQDRHGRDRDQSKHRAAHGREKAVAVFFLFQFIFQQLAGRKLHFRGGPCVIPCVFQQDIPILSPCGFLQDIPALFARCFRRDILVFSVCAF